MKKVLVISSIPYSNSNRGIDILTEAFMRIGYIVDHAVFPVYFNKTNKIDNLNKNINQIYINVNKVPYKENLMWWIPNKIIKGIVDKHTSGINLNFNNYDIVVLESGKPIFLIDKIPNNVKLIFRQSDSVKEILSKNKYLWELEEKVIKRADLIFVVKDIFKNLIEEKYHYKTRVVVNGFSALTSIDSYKNPYDLHSKNAIYLGYFPLDYKTLDILCKENNNINFNIIGKCLKEGEIKELSQYDNFKYFGNLTPDKYLPYVKYADMAIIPYKKNRGINFFGLSSKYLLFMHFDLPIISCKVGIMDDFNNIPIQFADDPVSFSKFVRDIGAKNEKQKYNIDFKYYEKEGRINEYVDIINNYFSN